MRNLLTIIGLALVLGGFINLVGNSDTAHAALSNANNPHMLLIPLGSPATDAKTLAGLRPGQQMVIQSVHVINAATIAADDSDFMSISLEKGPIASTTVVAELDTRAAHEDALVANIPEALNLVTAELTIAADEILSANYNETDSGTNVALTDAVLIVNYTVK